MAKREKFVQQCLKFRRKEKLSFFKTKMDQVVKRIFHFQKCSNFYNLREQK